MTRRNPLPQDAGSGASQRRGRRFAQARTADGSEDWLVRAPDNWSAEIAKAEREFARNKALIEAGETFRAHKAAEPRRRPSPNRGWRSPTVE